MLGYNLPKEWDKWTTERRIRWHRRRVRKEEPVFRLFEKMELMSCFKPEELKERLEKIRKSRRNVEFALVLAEDGEFKDTLSELSAAEKALKEIEVQRAKILREQFKRKRIANNNGEAEHLAILRKQANDKCNCGRVTGSGKEQV